MRSILATLVAFLICGVAVRADNLVGYVQNGTISAAQTQRRLKAIYGASAPAAPAPVLDLYKVRYRSRNAKGASVVLSSLVVLPHAGAPKGLVVFNHGTTADRNAAPSRFDGSYYEGGHASETELATLAFATGGYAVAMPDYVGLGDDMEAHPYPLSNTNSLSGIDLIEPARTVASRQKIAVGPKLFLTGYSEGGAIALWTVRNLENRAGAAYRVSSVAALSGPYDLTTATRESLLAPIANLQDVVVRLYFLGYTLDYFQRDKGIRLTDYFQPGMASVVSSVFNHGYSDEVVFKRLAVAAILFGGTSSIERVMTPRFVKAIRNFDLSDPVIREVQKNDCFDWSPKIPVLLTYLPTDTIVSSIYTHKTIKTMRARGIGPDKLRDYALPDRQLNHVTAIPLSVLMARRFFDGGFGAFPVGTN